MESSSFYLYIFILALFVTLCDSTQLQTLIDGNISSSAPCVGQNITFVCNVQSFNHLWSSSGFQLQGSISRAQQSIELRNFWPGYTLRVVSSDNISITSSLSVAMVTTQTTLNNTVISCTDGNSLNGDTQEIMATVLANTVENNCPSDIGDSTQLQTLIDGNISSSAPCVGQNITFVCTVQSFNHVWRSTGFPLQESISKVHESIELRNVWPGYTLRVVSSDDVSITSSLSVEVVTTQTVLNNTVISCTDGTNVNGATQDIMATVLASTEENQCPTNIHDPNELEVVIDGKNADEPSVCVGQNVTFVCTVLADTHAWSSPWLSQTMLISIGKSQFVNRGFTMQLITFNGMYITSSASINATTELNNTFVSCTDANSLNGDSQTINITVLGSPSAPSCEVVENEDLDGFIITLSPPVYAAQCVVYYNISIASTDGTSYFTADANANGGAVQAQISAQGFSICQEFYNFSAVAVTNSSIGVWSSVISFSPPTNISGECNSTNTTPILHTTQTHHTSSLNTSTSHISSINTPTSHTSSITTLTPHTEKTPTEGRYLHSCHQCGHESLCFLDGMLDMHNTYLVTESESHYIANCLTLHSIIHMTLC